jgi:hypothetical protein
VNDLLSLILWGGLTVVCAWGALSSLLFGASAIFPGMKDSLFTRAFAMCVCVIIGAIPALIAWESLEVHLRGVREMRLAKKGDKR